MQLLSVQGIDSSTLIKSEIYSFYLVIILSIKVYCPDINQLHMNIDPQYHFRFMEIYIYIKLVGCFLEIFIFWSSLYPYLYILLQSCLCEVWGYFWLHPRILRVIDYLMVTCQNSFPQTIWNEISVLDIWINICLIGKKI